MMGSEWQWRFWCLIPIGLCLGGNGPALALTALDSRPSDEVPLELTQRLQKLAGEIGWGSLFRTEQMVRADTAYGAGPVLAVTATPSMPVLAYLESRAWAAERFLAEGDADRRFAELYLDPTTGLVFDLLVIAETPEALRSDALIVTFRDSTGSNLPGTFLEHDVALEPALGGALHAARARVMVVLPDGHDWATAEAMTFELQALDQDFALTWTFP
ncbi:MAG: hypothetical protein H6852_03820 [Geminicoccaceae bacterium]|nr:hypothetical protein [Geminicoccaceae bacterium]